MMQSFLCSAIKLSELTFSTEFWGEADRLLEALLAFLK